MMTTLGLRGELCWIPASDLRIDSRYQRAIHPEHLERMIAQFNPDGLGTLQISLRSDGRYYVLDGQHRVLMVIRLGLGHMALECVIRRGLSLEKEEELFILFNHGHLPLDAYHAFATRVRAEDFDAETIQELTAKFGLTIVKPGVNLGVRQVSALGLLEQLVRDDTLDPVLSVISLAWGEEKGAYKALHLKLVARLLQDISPEHLVPVLQQLGPTALDQQALARQTTPGVQFGSYLAVCRDMLHEQAVHQAPRRPAR